MEFIERTNLLASYWIMTQPKPVLLEILKRRKGSETVESKYNRLMNFLKDTIKGNGAVIRTYTYSYTTVPDWGGRLYSGTGIQGQPREIRGLLMRDTTDIDMKNAHPVILRYLCHQEGILCPNLDGYVLNRDQILASFPNRDKAKEMFLTAMNDNKLKKGEHSNKRFKHFDEEMKDIQTMFYNMEKYNDIRQSIPSDKAQNPQGSMLNRILCSWENKILQIAIDSAKQSDLEIAVPMFDGFMVYGNHYDRNDLLVSLNEATNNAFPTLGIEWTFKPHCMELTVPEGFEIPEDTDAKKALVASEKKRENDEEIALRLAEFEKNHCKIINADLYVIEQPEVIEKPFIFKSREKLQNAYSHLAHIKPDPNKSQTVPFITYWVTDNPRIRSYRDMDTYPNPDLCPPDMYNLWTPFLGETQPPAPVNHNGVVDFFRDHILTLSGMCPRTAKYFECWIAHMIQYPEIKSNCPVLISKEGAGKGQTMGIFKGMLGDPKVYECTNPSRDILGSFNGKMANGFLVNINEAKRKDTSDGMGQFYALITDHKITINEKGTSQYDVTSYHRFIVTTNKTDPIDISASNRRFWIVRCSDKRVNDREYFKQMGAYSSDPVAMKSLYDYFKHHTGFGEEFTIHDFNSIPMPTSEFQKNIQNANLPIPTQWLIHFTETHPEMSEVTMTSSTVYSEFRSWQDSMGLDIKLSSIKLGLALVNDTNGLVVKGPRHSRGNSQIFYLNAVREQYGIETTLPQTPANFYGGKDEEEDNRDF